MHAPKARCGGHFNLLRKYQRQRRVEAAPPAHSEALTVQLLFPITNMFTSLPDSNHKPAKAALSISAPPPSSPVTAKTLQHVCARQFRVKLECPHLKPLQVLADPYTYQRSHQPLNQPGDPELWPERMLRLDPFAVKWSRMARGRVMKEKA